MIVAEPPAKKADQAKAIASKIYPRMLLSLEGVWFSTPTDFLNRMTGKKRIITPATIFFTRLSFVSIKMLVPTYAPTTAKRQKTRTYFHIIALDFINRANEPISKPSEPSLFVAMAT